VRKKISLLPLIREKKRRGRERRFCSGRAEGVWGVTISQRRGGKRKTGLGKDNSFAFVKEGYTTNSQGKGGGEDHA